MQDWTKGVIFVNGFNIGRYWDKGPQKTLYIPAPLLKYGNNEVGCPYVQAYLFYSCIYVYVNIILGYLVSITGFSVNTKI